MFQEFPKGLRKGDEWRIVFDAAEESRARDDGYCFGEEGDDAPEPKKRPGRPPKAKE